MFDLDFFCLLPIPPVVHKKIEKKKENIFFFFSQATQFNPILESKLALDHSNETLFSKEEIGIFKSA